MALEVSNLNVSYGQSEIIRDISFCVSNGELVCVFGSNGHGKSTLLKALCGLVKIASGKVKYKGIDITYHKTYEIVRRGITYIPEDRNLFLGMTVMENLKLGAYLPEARAKEKDNLQAVFNLFPRLLERQNQITSTLSGGELRMVAVGRGLMTGADCLFIDEPSAGLSPILKIETFNIIQQINKQRNCTIVLVEQNIKEAIYLSNKVYLLKGGKFVFEGTKEILDEETVKNAFF